MDDLYKVNAVITALRQKLPTDFSCQIIAPKSEKDGNVGLSILIEGETDVNVDALCAIDGAAYAVKE